MAGGHNSSLEQSLAQSDAALVAAIREAGHEVERMYDLTWQVDGRLAIADRDWRMLADAATSAEDALAWIEERL